MSVADAIEWWQVLAAFFMGLVLRNSIPLLLIFSSIKKGFGVAKNWLATTYLDAVWDSLEPLLVGFVTTYRAILMGIGGIICLAFFLVWLGLLLSSIDQVFPFLHLIKDLVPAGKITP